MTFRHHLSTLMLLVAILVPAEAKANFHCSVREYDFSGRFTQDENLTTPRKITVKLTVTVEDNRKAAEYRSILGQGPLKFSGTRILEQTSPEAKKSTEELVPTVKLTGTGPFEEGCTAVLQKAYMGALLITCPARKGLKAGSASCRGPLED